MTSLSNQIMDVTVVVTFAVGLCMATFAFFVLKVLEFLQKASNRSTS